MKAGKKTDEFHGCLVHAELRNDKIWIHYNGIENSITAELVAAGVPKEHIVLAFHPPEVREHKGYAVTWQRSLWRNSCIIAWRLSYLHPSLIVTHQSHHIYP